jgi:hypothetical protein
MSLEMVFVAHKILDRRKVPLHTQLWAAEQAAMDKIMQEGELMKLHKDVAAAGELTAQDRKQYQDKIELLALVMEERMELHKRAAQVMLQIDALDEDSIDSFKVPDFNVGA